MKEIDWEQRRYEITRDILVAIVGGNVASSTRFTDMTAPQIADYASENIAFSVAIADALVGTLQKMVEKEGEVQIKELMKNETISQGLQGGNVESSSKLGTPPAPTPNGENNYLLDVIKLMTGGK